MRAEDVQVNPYVPMTEMAREKKTSSPKYLIQSWMRSNTTIEYGYGKRSITLNLKKLLVMSWNYMVHTTSTTLTPSLWINTTRALGMRTSCGKGGGTIAHP